MKKVALVYLTWNRLDFVKRAVPWNYEKAGYPIEKIVIVDNGSHDGTKEWLLEWLKDKPHKIILHETNKGVGKGYNAAYKNVGDVDLVARPSSDMLMPDGWLKDMVEAHEKVENTGIVAMISKSFKDYVHHRYLAKPEDINGVTITEANALGSITFDKKILDKDIYLPELDNLYGFEDTLWTNKVREAGYRTYYIDGVAEDFPDEEIQKYNDYVNWKGDQVRKFEQSHPELAAELNKRING